MNDAGYTRWTRTEWWPDGYERLWRGENLSRPVGDSETTQASLREHIASDGELLTDGGSSSEKTIQQGIIYLTADSGEELTELNPDETYIIGGICDHNRYKVDDFTPVSAIFTNGRLEPLPQ